MKLRICFVLGVVTYAFLPLCQAAFFDHEPSGKKYYTELQVQDYIAKEAYSAGLRDIGSDKEVQNRMDVADLMASKAGSKTWATTYSLSEFKRITFPIVPDPHGHLPKCFGYPQGESSGGYSGFDVTVDERNIYTNWKNRAREIARDAYYYFCYTMPATFSAKFLELIPEDSGRQDNNKDIGNINPKVGYRKYPGIYRATHAELKLLVRLMLQGDLRKEEHVFISISSNMCPFCRDIVSFLAVNGHRKIFTAAPGSIDGRKGREYLYFKPDGSYEECIRQSDGRFKCTYYFPTYKSVPKKYFDYQPPSHAPAEIRCFNPATTRQIGTFNDQIFTGRKLPGFPFERHSSEVGLDIDRNRIAVNSDFQTVSETNVNQGYVSHESRPSCFAIGNVREQISCPGSQNIVGIHGAIGPVSDGTSSLAVKSIGLFCGGFTRMPAKGSFGNTPFELKCPDFYLLTGISGHFNGLFRGVGISCRSIFDGRVVHSRVPGLPGSFEERQECELRTAGAFMRYGADGYGIRGLEFCCN